MTSLYLETVASSIDSAVSISKSGTNIPINVANERRSKRAEFQATYKFRQPKTFQFHLSTCQLLDTCQEADVIEKKSNPRHP